MGVINTGQKIFDQIKGQQGLAKYQHLGEKIRELNKVINDKYNLVPN